jgi:hypothetical protein
MRNDSGVGWGCLHSPQVKSRYVEYLLFTIPISYPIVEKKSRKPYPLALINVHIADMLIVEIRMLPLTF